MLALREQVLEALRVVFLPMSLVWRGWCVIQRYTGSDRWIDFVTRQVVAKRQSKVATQRRVCTLFCEHAVRKTALHRYE